ncbi:hypothetical protein [Phenylobacterium sp.]|uniref:hypothetical protein n=1 Tax=Phenylobacterium sp. TaxID=1871053 RepID=UPI0025E0281F|nr:hypothetical protein [Phenylobacterium sp.]MBX3482523.1 hypothetical protein [Phenylobacterium sp.]
MSGSAQCPHTDVHFDLNVARFGDTNVGYLEIVGRCKICDAPMRFRGAPLGVTPAHPTMALDGSEIRLPFLFGDEEYDGKCVGFVVGVAS